MQDMKSAVSDSLWRTKVKNGSTRVLEMHKSSQSSLNLLEKWKGNVSKWPLTKKILGNDIDHILFNDLTRDTIANNFVICFYCTLGGIASICFRSHFQQTLRMHTQGCQGCQKTRNFVRNSKILIARSTIQPKLSKIKNNLPFFKEFWWIS